MSVLFPSIPCLHSAVGRGEGCVESHCRRVSRAHSLSSPRPTLLRGGVENNYEFMCKISCALIIQHLKSWNCELNFSWDSQNKTKDSYKEYTTIVFVFDYSWFLSIGTLLRLPKDPSSLMYLKIKAWQELVKAKSLNKLTITDEYCFSKLPHVRELITSYRIYKLEKHIPLNSYRYTIWHCTISKIPTKKYS